MSKWSSRDEHVLDFDFILKYFLIFIYLIAPGLTCGTWNLRSACGIFFFFSVAAYRLYFTDPGLNPGPLHWEYGVLTTGPSRKSHSLDFQTQKSISLRQRGLFQTPIKTNISLQVFNLFFFPQKNQISNRKLCSLFYSLINMVHDTAWACAWILNQRIDS